MDDAICSVLNSVSFLSIIRQALVTQESINDSPTNNKIAKHKLIRVRKIADIVARDITTNFRDTHYDSLPPNRYCDLMRKVSLDIYSKYVFIKDTVEVIFEEVKRKDGTGYTIVDAFNGVIIAMLGEQNKDKKQFNWGRVSMIFTVAAIMAHNCRRKNPDYTEKLVKQILHIFQQEKIDEWILKNGGWDSFADRFENYEAKIKRTLYMTALGLGALASLPCKF